MNKAFLREPDQADSRCPRCDSMGHAVGPQTLQARLAPDVRQVLAESAYFCPDSRCDVVYYDDFGGVVKRDQVPGPIPIKDLDAPLCACFGLTRQCCAPSRTRPAVRPRPPTDERASPRFKVIT